MSVAKSPLERSGLDDRNYKSSVSEISLSGPDWRTLEGCAQTPSSGGLRLNDRLRHCSRRLLNVRMLSDGCFVLYLLSRGSAWSELIEVGRERREREKGKGKSPKEGGAAQGKR